MADNLPALPQDVEDYIGLGGVPPAATIGQQEFKEQDHSKGWDSSGVAHELATSMIPDLTWALADEAKKAVLEYTGNAFMRPVPVQGSLCVMLDASNAQVKHGVLWQLLPMLREAIEEAAASGDQALIAAAGQFHGDLGAVLDTFRPPAKPAPEFEPEPEPSRPVAGGAGRFAGNRLAANRGGPGAGGNAVAPGKAGPSRGRTPGAGPRSRG